MSNQQQNRQAPAQYTEPRIPYDPRLKEKFGISQSHWRLLVEQTFPAAKTAEGILLAVSYCRTRQLDIFKRPVHVVPIWDSQQGREIESVWPGIGELRITAARTKLYAGKDAAVFGPTMTHEFSGFTKKGGEQKISVTFPEWCQVTVYKMVDGQRCAFEGPKVYWMETYARLGKTDLPNSMWQKRAYGQLAKCAEAEALRGAFPEEIGDDYIPEEADTAFMRDVTPPRPRQDDYREHSDEANTSEEPVKESAKSEQEPQAEDQGADDADDFPGDKPWPQEKADEKQKPKPKSSGKAAKPAQKQASEPDEKVKQEEQENPDPHAKWTVEGDTFTYLPNWTKKLKEAKAPEDVDAMKGVNSERIAKFNDELQKRLYEAADQRKDELSG